MAKPTFGQMEEFFKQVTSDKITDSSLQLFLDGLRKVEPLSFDQYSAMIENLRCWTEGCGGFHKLKGYDHDGGWLVANFDRRQWLSTICMVCQKETSLRLWGIPTNIVKG